jgi:hypothetical protein
LRAGRVLAPASRATLVTPVLDGYAYGWNVSTTTRGTRLIHHGGADAISLVTFRWFADEDTFVVICNNSLNGGFAPDYVMADVEALLFGGAGSTPPPVAARDADRRPLGRYKLPSGGVIDVVPVAGGPLIARSFDPDAVIALRFGGAPVGKPLLYGTFFHDGKPEIQTYSLTADGGVLRTITGASGASQRDEQRMPPGIEAVLAPAPGGGWTAWDFKLRSAVRVTVDGNGLHLRGAAGEIVASALPKEN